MLSLFKYRLSSAYDGFREGFCLIFKGFDVSIGVVVVAFAVISRVLFQFQYPDLSRRFSILFSLNSNFNPFAYVSVSVPLKKKKKKFTNTQRRYQITNVRSKVKNLVLGHLYKVAVQLLPRSVNKDL